MTLVFIHGSGQGSKDPEILRKQLCATLNASLYRHGLRIPNHMEIAVPHYGRILDVMISETFHKADGNGQASTGKQSFELFLSSLKKESAISDEGVLQPYLGLDQGRKRTILERILGIRQKSPLDPILKGLTLRQFALETFAYLFIPSIRKAINESVSGQFQWGQQVIVGHCLGSIIGYDLLRDHQNPVKQFVTVGCPLGFNSISKRLPSPMTIPACLVEGWTNLYDRTDGLARHPVGHEIVAEGRFKNNSEIVNRGRGNRHDFQDYLDDFHVACAIAAACDEKLGHR